MKIRIKFSKYGVMKYIGHLDMMRYFQKAIRRAGIDIAYSEGFSPHQVMSFAAPLGVGLLSKGEYFDIEVYSVTTKQDMIDSLNQEMVEGVHIEDLCILPDGTKNAMASVAAASYFVTLKEDCDSPFSWENSLNTFLNNDKILIVKKTKKSEAELNLKPSIYSCHYENKGIYMMVDASSKGNIKPILVMKAFYEFNHAILDDLSLQITRMDTYGDKTGNFNQKDGADLSLEHEFVPLIEFGGWDII